VSDGRRRLGAQGEEAVAQWYRARGYEVLDRNWRCPGGELDLVVAGDQGRVLAFCEVKTRSTTAFGSPFEAVNPAKQRRLRRLAGQWVQGRKPPWLQPLHLRIDVAAVTPGPGGTLVVDVIEDAC